MSAVKYIDSRHGLSFPITDLRWRSDSGAPLMISPLPGITKDDIDSATRSIWRYKAALPLSISPVSLGEGCTPLISKQWGADPIFFKLEWFNPTCSFKDRGASVMISYLAQMGVKKVLEDSSGNGGAAIAAYCAAAGMAARILAPENTSPAKVFQSRSFGAEVQLVPGTRSDTEKEVIRQSDETFYAGHNWHPFFLQGTKTIAYELWEDLGFQAPDNIVIPTGAGSNVLGCDLGFTELLAAGQIKKLPKLLLAQPSNCAPIHASFIAGVEHEVQATFRPTMAEGAAIRNPVRLAEVVQAIRRSNGATVGVSEQEIAQATLALAALGLYAEPTSALAAAAVHKFKAAGSIKQGETTVVLLTGTAIKAPTVINQILDEA